MAIMNGILFQKLLRGGLEAIIEEEQKINGLNVFPVPDGDTGTNMRLTLEHGVTDAMENTSIGEYAKQLSRGMLLGARGNSGVILSQIFKGMYLYFKGKEEVDAKGLGEAFISGYQNAYRVVANPVEGTILTVARLGIENIKENITEDTSFEEFFIQLIDSMKAVLATTPDLLPVLKDAGVIDSGGAGLIVIIEGMYGVLTGKVIPHTVVEVKEKETVSFDENSVLEFGYCTEFILQLQKSKGDPETFDMQGFLSFLEAKGDSIVCFQEDTLVKVHVHTMTPGDVINEAQKYGEFVTFKMENMSIQHNEVMKKNHKKIAIVAVAQGEGFKNLFSNFGCDIVLDGGKTMNTSTEEFLSAFAKVQADDIIVLPNHKNIYMAAMQAKDLYTKAKIHVLATTSLVDGYYALSMSDTSNDVSIEEQLSNMKVGLEGNITVGVTMAVRNTTLDGIEIERGAYFSVVNGRCAYASMDRKEAVFEGLKSIVDMEDKETIIVFKGKNISEEEGDEIVELLSDAYSNAQVGLIEGDQDTFAVLLGIS